MPCPGPHRKDQSVECSRSPPGCVRRVARIRGVHIPARGEILGTPLGHPDSVRAQLEYSSISHQTLLERIPAVLDVQSAWLILLLCAQARANYLLRLVRPDAVRDFAQNHDAGLFQCLCRILQIQPTLCVHESRETTTLPLVLGGLGVRESPLQHVGPVGPIGCRC